jgi:hypothetical protein
VTSLPVAPSALSAQKFNLTRRARAAYTPPLPPEVEQQSIAGGRSFDMLGQRREGRENRPQLRYGNASDQTSTRRIPRAGQRQSGSHPVKARSEAEAR